MFFIFLISIVGCFFLGTKNVQAASGGYAIKPAGESTDTVNIDNGSYVITGDPGQEVELKLMVINSEKEKRTFLYRVNTAYTSNSGEIGYDDSKVSDSALKIQTRDLATPKQSTFQVPANTTATITFKMKIPEKSFKGYLMGGVNVAPYKEKAKGTVGSNGTLIQNKFSYSIPIQIHQKNAESEDAKYSVTAVRPSVIIGSEKTSGVKANVHNSTNSYAGSLDSKAVVTKKGDKNFKITQSASNQSIAPTSNYDYSISWGKKALQSGNYHLKLTYKTKGGLKGWVINKDFTITNNQAAKYNKLAGRKPNYMWLYILLGILALAIILGLGIYLGRKNNKNNSEKTTRRRRR